MERELKLSFIQRALADYGQRVVAAMRREIKTQKVEDTRELLNSLSYEVYKKASADGGLTLSFAEWGRFVDMGASRGHPAGSVKATGEALDRATKRVRKKKRDAGGRFLPGKSKKDPPGVRKPRKIYSPVVYGNLTGLYGDLLYGFTDAVKDSIKKELLQNGTVTNSP